MKISEAKVVKAIPTNSGNGFIKGDVYEFKHHINGLFVTYIKRPISCLKRYECFGKKSSHLWNGKNEYKMGKFNIIEIDGVPVSDVSKYQYTITLVAQKNGALNMYQRYETSFNSNDNVTICIEADAIRSMDGFMRVYKSYRNISELKIIRKKDL